MLSFSAYEEPNIFFENDDHNGFKLFTLTTNIQSRHYRIIKETDNGFYNFDFSLDLSNLQNGQPYLVNIPFNDGDFTNYSSYIKPISPTDITIGSTITEGIYKLIYISKEEDEEIPAKVELNKIYSVDTRKIKIIYYRQVGEENYYTGYFGNRILNDQVYPHLAVDTTKLFDRILQYEDGDQIEYYVVKIYSTPNIISSSYKKNINYYYDTYTDDEYEYFLRSPGDGLFGINFMAYLKYRKKGETEYLKTANEFSTRSLSNINVLRIFPPDERSNEYIFHFSSISVNVDFRIYIKT